ncbi:MAG: four helix bundle protein [Candidatus Marinimicrobia bacterium]|jgi:four helix bundle protein|nr:four helix bundle protein [Candidatus Neomarinimicrobiota bacterium]
MNDLSKRLFKFSVRVLKLTKQFPNIPEFKVIRYQLSKSASSSGANYEEAQAATSRADFHHKVKISLREVREANFWLRQLKEIIDDELDLKEIRSLIKESTELKNILGTIALKTKS